MPNKTFIILGPDGNDGVPMHWNRESFEWVESAAPSFLTLYSKLEIVSFPPRELPVGVGCLMDMENGVEWVPLPMGGWGPNKI